jgi:Holliday junction resolvase RusA-like endonuclease
MAEALSTPAPEPLEFSVRVAGTPVGTNAAYAPVVFTPKGQKRPVARIRLTKEGETWREMIRMKVLAARVHAVPHWRTDGKSYEILITYDFASAMNDIDGPIKLTLDALHDVVYENDRQVQHLDVTRRVNPADPGVELTIRLLRAGPPIQKALL